MRKIAGCLLLFLAGCVSREKATLKEREAYVAGQQQAIGQAQTLIQSTTPVTTVTVKGNVKNPVVTWTEDLTVAQAIVTAQYLDFMNPRLIRVIRNNEVIQEFKPIDLENGHDMPLEAGDVVEIVP